MDSIYEEIINSISTNGFLTFNEPITNRCLFLIIVFLFLPMNENLARIMLGLGSHHQWDKKFYHYSPHVREIPILFATCAIRLLLIRDIQIFKMKILKFAVKEILKIATAKKIY